MAKDFSNLNDPPYPRGIVNNNPGNLRIGIPWQGLKLGIPGGFCAFVNLAYGIRAMAKDLTTKIKKDGLNTIRKEVTKYAPPSENDTEKYISRVSSYTGWGADQVIDLTPDSLLKLIRAHMRVELGDQYAAMIDDADIVEGISIMDQTVFQQAGNIITNNPELSAYAGIGILAIAIGIMLIYTRRVNIKKLFQ